MIRYGQGAVSRLATVCSLLLVMVTSAWGATASAPVKVAATIFPLYDLVRQVAGAAAEVVLLVPPGASPHTFTVKPGTVRALTGCAAVFTIGHGLDDWAARLAQEAGVKRTIVTDAGVPLRRGYHEHHGAGQPKHQRVGLKGQAGEWTVRPVA